MARSKREQANEETVGEAPKGDIGSLGGAAECRRHGCARPVLGPGRLAFVLQRPFDRYVAGSSFCLDCARTLHPHTARRVDRMLETYRSATGERNTVALVTGMPRAGAPHAPPPRI